MGDFVHEEPDVIGAFYDRVRRNVRDGLTQYREELRAVSAKMAASGTHNSGGHLKSRADVLAKRTQALTDQIFEDVTRLPGDQNMHRIVHTDFLAEQLNDFLRQAEGDVLCFDPGPAATNAISERIEKIRDGLKHDLRDFHAGLWRSRSHGHVTSITHNTVNIRESKVGAVQQAGHVSTQSAVVHFNVEAARTALEDFAVTLRSADIPDTLKEAATLEIETIRPQLRKATPSIPIVHEGLHSLRNILEGVAAGLLANKLTALLIAAGITIAS